MKKIILVVFVFFAFSATAGSTEFYHCVDQEGNVFITDNPPQDVKCQSSEMDEKASAESQSGSELPQAQPRDYHKDEIKRLLKIKRPGMI